MSSAEFTEWIGYRRIVGPLGEVRADLRMGITLAAYFNSKQNKQRFTPSEFMPFLHESEGSEDEDSDGERMTPAEQLAYLRALNAMLGGREVKRGN